jgi:hypothetical protein
MRTTNTASVVRATAEVGTKNVAAERCIGQSLYERTANLYFRIRD